MFTEFYYRGGKVKGNGIQEAKAAQAQLIKENHALGLRVSDLLEQNDRQAKEIHRLTKLTSNYGQVCKDCCTANSKQEELQNQLDDALYERDFAVYGLVMIFVVTIGKVLIWGF
jgi:hypothetical protein